MCMLNLTHAGFFPVQKPKSLCNSNAALETGTQLAQSRTNFLPSVASLILVTNITWTLSSATDQTLVSCDSLYRGKRSCPLAVSLHSDNLIYDSFHSCLCKGTYQKSCKVFLGSYQTKPLFLTPFIPSLCSHAPAKGPQFFTVLCVAVRAKVSCLAIDCILPNWFPYEIGSSTSPWQHGQVQHFMLPAAVFSTFLHTHWLRAVPKQDGIDKNLKRSFRGPTWWGKDVSVVVDRCFLNGWPWEGSLCSTVLPYCRK